MDDFDDVDEIDDSCVCRCIYEKDEKNQKILVGFGLLAETSVLTPISRDNNRDTRGTFLLGVTKRSHRGTFATAALNYLETAMTKRRKGSGFFERDTRIDQSSRADL